MRKAAVAYATRGWAVFPVKAGEKVPATRNGCKDATTDIGQVERWWTTEHNIGIATGDPSGLWVVDIDGDDGLDAFARLGHGIPGTLTAYTPSGGVHLLFVDPGGLGNTASKIAPNVDTRGTGGYIVGAPSIHPNGGRYRWGGKQDPEPVPGWLIRLVRQPPPPPRPKRTVTGDTVGYAASALEAEAATVAAAVEGTRNDTLNRAGFNVGTLVGAGVCDHDTAWTTLADAAAAAGLPGGEVRKTLTAALDAGTAHPRQVPA